MLENKPPQKGRGATFNPANRYAHQQRESTADAWQSSLLQTENEPPPLKTTVTIHPIRSIISRNNSPDLNFRQTINPYQGCEHGCIYCYARPSHAYLDLSPGFDFESRLFAKPDAAEQLRREFMNPSYKPQLIVIGTNTDAYQPIDREWKITRQLLEVFEEFKHPVGLITKSALIERDMDILSRLSKDNLVQVFISVTTLDKLLARKMEPRAATPHRRLDIIKHLTQVGIPVGVMTAPLIPMINDRDMEAILEASYAVGARHASYVLIRLPHELKELFGEWLKQHYPLRAAHVMSLIRQMRGGKDYDANFATRQQGVGHFAKLLEQRFQIACKRWGFNQTRMSLKTSLFRKPSVNKQMPLF